MKKQLLILAVIFISTASLGQEVQKQEKVLSKAEQFSARSGTLIQKEYLKIGEVGILAHLSVEVCYYKDLNTNEKINALIIGRSLIRDSYSAIFDSDEIDGLIKSIKFMKENVFPTMPSNYTEIIYKNKRDFELACFYDEKKKQWSILGHLDYRSDSRYILGIKDLDLLLNFLEQAKGKI
jgi:hypothetical protein